MTGDSHPPRRYPGVMISSTFRDLPRHRAAVLAAVESQGLHAVAMEQDGALPHGTDVEASLRKVRDASAYVGIVGHAYGRIPESAELNPDRLSLTELEFREARTLDRPILIFIMSDEHPVTKAAVERDPEKIRKLDAFRGEVRRVAEGSPLHRVYAEFDSEADLAVVASRSVAELRRHLDEPVGAAPDLRPGPAEQAVPRPPALYAVPRYTRSQEFVGRTAQMETISTWAGPSDPHPMLLFEAIGGTGKSMLTWEWAIRHSSGDAAGRDGTFWYSFYERGAVMADFCRRALAYTTGRPVADFEKCKQPELSDLLLRQLEDRPWLMVLDGLERVLVAYHRSDAAQLADEDAGTSDEIADRNPCAAIRRSDDELLERLAAASPSKILVTSRLVPRVLLNRAGQPVPGVLLERLPGLRPAEAEDLLRRNGVHGTSATIRSYLQRHCDCHPLVTGIVAGLVSDYLPDRGHFDPWAADPRHGGRLDVGELDLVQKRNHILEWAITSLPGPGRRLLCTLALLSDSADYETLVALNPHPPAGAADTSGSALEELQRTTLDLEHRGLLQYDSSVRRYDLHPVVRAVASRRLDDADRDELGQRVVDHFSRRSGDLLYEKAETLDDLRDALTVFHTLVQMGRTGATSFTFRGRLAVALRTNLEAHEESLSLIHSLLAQGWTVQPDGMPAADFGYLPGDAALSLRATGELTAALAAESAVVGVPLARRDWPNLVTSLMNSAVTYGRVGRSAAAARCGQLALELAELVDNAELLFMTRLLRFQQLTDNGRWSEASDMWRLLDPMGRGWNRAAYRPGDAEYEMARHLFQRGHLTAFVLDRAEELAESGHNRRVVRMLRRLRARWHLGRGDLAAGAADAADAARMAHAAGLDDGTAETLLAIARIRLDATTVGPEEAYRLARSRGPSHQALCDLWRMLGDTGEAVRHATAAYRAAWADGEPHVRRYALDRSRAALEDLGAPVPDLLAYDAARDPGPDWMEPVADAIAELRATAGATADVP